MSFERFSIKFLAKPDSEIDDAILIDIFHEWIRTQKLGGVLLDVADYRHVPHGPGVMLLTHDINYSLDYGGGRLGLLAQRKRGSGITLHERIAGLIQSTLVFGALLEADPRLAGQLSLDAGTFEFKSHDRLLAPNTVETFAEVVPTLIEATNLLYQTHSVTVDRVENDEREAFTVVIDTEQSFAMQTLLEQTRVVA